MKFLIITCCSVALLLVLADARGPHDGESGPDGDTGSGPDSNSGVAPGSGSMGFGPRSGGDGNGNNSRLSELFGPRSGEDGNSQGDNFGFQRGEDGNSQGSGPFGPRNEDGNSQGDNSGFGNGENGNPFSGRKFKRQAPGNFGRSSPRPGPSSALPSSFRPGGNNMPSTTPSSSGIFPSFPNIFGENGLFNMSGF